MLSYLHGVGHVLRRDSEEVGAYPRDEPDESVPHAHPSTFRDGETETKPIPKGNGRREKRQPYHHHDERDVGSPLSSSILVEKHRSTELFTELSRPCSR